MDVQVEDISEKVAALALQGPTSAKLLKAVADADIANLKYFRVTRGKIAGVPVDISRTGYTGDLGYEIWMPWNDAVKVWDALADKGKQFDLHAAGMLALDVARVEAGLLLIEVDYTSSKKALIPSQKFSPYELGFSKMVHLGKENFIGKRALERGCKERRAASVGGPGSRLDRHRTTLRPLRPHPGRSVASVARSRARVLRRETGRQSDDYDLVANPEKAHRVGQRGNRICEAGNSAPDGNHDRSNALKTNVKVTNLPFFNPPRKTATPV